MSEDSAVSGNGTNRDWEGIALLLVTFAGVIGALVGGLFPKLAPWPQWAPLALMILCIVWFAKWSAQGGMRGIGR